MSVPAVFQHEINHKFFTHQIFVSFTTKPKKMTVTFATMATVVKNK
jgi:hypothetical protein